MGKQGTIRIGISGWTYKPWRGVFYPKGLPHSKELAHAAQRFPSIEINGTFYGMQRPESFARWREETPDDFVFAVKGSRYITHMKRLKDVEAPLANFMASGVLLLGKKLGPILWQFPPRMKFDPDRFAAFLELLPRDMDEAARLARRHDGRMKGRAFVDARGKQPLHHAIEIRHASFCTEEFIALLRRYGDALVVADAPEWPLLMDVTADFVYCRLHGSEQLYASGYDDEALGRWAARICAWAQGREPEDASRVLGPVKPRASGRDVYVYFDNDAKVRAPFDAASLISRLTAMGAAKAA
ncbi:DUF72 domain-containing protein [Chelativorans sp. Marseille-P2723]|uniref:DUF72 domain-containing protein n=1 Tax=Chelativorans sp. Marseille-P2723 TaxID=2709133 RepID=UPI00156D7D29|nr:DUF72 domain-containing protein [Chelativorans sp. Marseille-P2723]